MFGSRTIHFFVLSVGVILCSEALAQKTKAQLKRERARNVQKIKETERILSETKAQKKNSIGELNALNQRIQQQEKLTRFIQNEISLLNVDIDENVQIIRTLEKDLSSLKQEYASMLIVAQKTRNKIGVLMLLFSSESFTQLWTRIKYMKQYSKTRQNQVEAITRIRNTLHQQVEKMQIVKREKNALLKNRIEENQYLIALKQEQQRLTQELEQDEQRLKRELEQTQKAVAALDKLISEIIKREIELAARKTRRAKGAVNSALSSSFAKNKSKFSWPVSGFISQQFGTQRHPLLKGIQVHNDGINIQTRANEPVKAIFEGEVRAIAFIPSIGNSVIIGHGEYFTVYAGLKEVLVKKAQRVKTAQNIGNVLTNTEGISELRFQIRKNMVAEDPEKWLRK